MLQAAACADKRSKSARTLPHPINTVQDLIVVKMLADRGINKIVAGELSPGVSALLEQFNIKPRTKAIVAGERRVLLSRKLML